MFARIVGSLRIAGAVVIGAWVLLSVPSAALAFVSWALMGYLVWRAWPAVREDVRRLPRPRLSALLRVRRGGAARRGGDL